MHFMENLLVLRHIQSIKGVGRQLPPTSFPPLEYATGYILYSKNFMTRSDVYSNIGLMISDARIKWPTYGA